MLQAEAVAFVREHAPAGPVLIVAATIDAADEIARAACDGALLGVHRTTLDVLAHTLASAALAESELAPVTGLAMQALAARIARARRDTLRYFEPVVGYPGFPRALARTLRDLRAEQITARELRRAGAPGADLVLLLDAYEQELAEHGLIDRSDLLRFAAEASHPLLGIPLLVYEAGAETGVEHALLQALERAAPAVLHARIEPSACEGAGALASLQRNLFQRSGDASRDGSFQFFSAASEALECVEISRRILAAAAEGVTFDHIAVLLRNPGLYQSALEEALRRAHIPGHFSSGVRRPDAAGRALLLLLECAAEGLSAARFCEYLTLEQRPSSWEELIREAAVVRGLDRWDRRLEVLRGRYEQRLNDAHEAKREFLAGRIDAAYELSAFALPLIRLLHELPRQASWGEWLDALESVAEAGLREPDATIQLFEELRPMSDMGPVTLDDVRLLLGDRLRSLRQAGDNARYGSVFCGAIEDARGLSFPLVFVPGLSEGLFPKPLAEDPLLLDEAKRKVSDALRPAAEDEERNLLRLAAASARDCLVLSWPAFDVAAGRERVPSLYIFEALKAAYGAHYDAAQLRRDATAGLETTLGWPAPTQPEDAIDATEFDLAILRHAFQTGEPGSAAYLLSENEALANALRGRWRRWSNKWWAEDGLVDLEIEALQLLASYRPDRTPHSPSALQEYARCPYRFALRAIYGFRDQQDDAGADRASAATLGRIFHRVLYELGSERTPEALDAAFARVEQEFREEVDPAVPQLWEADMARVRADLHGWLLHTQQTGEWAVLAREQGFGDDPRVAILDGFLIRGTIDAIERSEHGALRVVDYKTGKLPEPLPERVGKGEVLQPALYALAAEQIYANRVTAGRLLYATQRANFRGVEIALDEATRTRAGAVLRAIDEALDSGNLPACPRQDACKNCEYRPVCGPYEEERTVRKPHAEVPGLQQIRMWK